MKVRQSKALVGVLLIVIGMLLLWGGLPAAGQDEDPAALNDQVVDLYQQGRFQEAITLAERALRLREATLGPEHPATAASLNNLALLYGRMGDYSRAERLFQRALAIREKVLGSEHPDTTTSLNNLAFVQIDLGHPKEALALARRALQAEEAALANILIFSSEKQRLAYQASVDPYVLPATLDSALDLARAALRFKGIVLDSLVEDQRVASASGAPAIRAQVDELRAAKRRLTQLTREVPNDLSPEGVELRRQERQKAQGEVERLEGELVRAVAGLGRAPRSLAVTTDQVQAAIPEEAVLVEFLRHRFYLGKNRFEERYGAVLLAHQGPPRWVVLGKAEDIDAQVRAFCEGAEKPTSDLDVSRKLKGLHDRLWAPLAKYFPAGTRMVLLSPDGELSFLPWVTLLTPEDRFLAEDFDLRCLSSSGRDLLEQVGKPASPQAMALGDVAYSLPSTGAAAVASPADRSQRAMELDPLPGTAVELDELERICRAKGIPIETVRGQDASESWVRSARSPRILHLATHGFFLPTIQIAPPGAEASTTDLEARGVRLVNPMQRSGLALAGAQRTAEAWKRGETPPSADDGFLTAEEVGTLDLSGTWLVCLTGSRTGLGEARSGEGVLGLRRGFVQAGARNLLMTLWDVADRETADFMRDFYEAALQDGNAPGALASTQKRWLTRLRQEKGLAEAVRLAGPFLLNFQGRP